jgi:hypothetical protein
MLIFDHFSALGQAACFKADVPAGRNIYHYGLFAAVRCTLREGPICRISILGQLMT